MRKAFGAGVALFIGACGAGRWESRPADRPLTRRELASRNLTVRGEAAFAEALAREGFRVVSHPPYHNDLEATVALDHRSDLATITLRSDGYFLDEVQGPANDPQALAHRLALGERMADFVRNSGVPQQIPITAH